MSKEIYYLIVMMLIFSSCEKIYRPPMDTVSGQLVVDAQISNDISRNVVHLTRTRSFYDDLPVLAVSGATVSLIQIGGPTLRGYESSSGNYAFNAVPESGKQYFLRIIIQSDTYESKAVTMPPLPTISNFYTTEVLTKYNENSGESTPRTYEKLGREVDVDLPLNDALSHYRFSLRSMIEWSWDSIPGTLFPDAYGWYSYQNNERFHLVGPKDLGETGKVIKHPLFTISYSPLEYFHSSLRSLIAVGWILFIDQYGISKESYHYHEQLNNQFAATGSLFDPVQTQIYGNILCKTKPSEIVYGFFDLYSYKHYRYFLKLPTPPLAIIIRPIFRFPVIPFDGEVRAIMPSALNPYPDPIKPPDWWEE